MHRSRTRVALIAAVADNKVIGSGNRLPWHLPADLKHFKSLTLDKPIVMGRRTWESLPGLLPRRTHIVVTRDPHYRAEGCVLVPSPEAALRAAGAVPEVMIVGGAELYGQFLPRANRMYLTLVHACVEGDVFFPPWDPREWSQTAREDHPADDRNGHAYSFLTLDRCRPST